MRTLVVVLLATALAAVHARPAARGSIDVDVADDGSYIVTVNGSPWFSSMDTYVTLGNTTYAAHNNTLKLESKDHSAGADSGGAYTVYNQLWTTGTTFWFTSIRVYTEHVVFSQKFLEDATGTATGNRQDVSSCFPSFNMSIDATRGYVSYQGDMTGSSTRVGTWGDVSALGTGVRGTGPIVVFKKDLSVSTVVSPYSNFMSLNQAYHKHTNTLAFGLAGSVDKVPAGFTLETIVSVGSGINQGMNTWGDILLSQYGKKRHAYRQDMAMELLGYSTDNGAYYYYQTEAGKNYEDTLIDVHEYAQKEGIPYKYVLLDSWWYYKGKYDGVKTWDAMPTIFPNGLEYLFNVTGWPTQLHNRFWAPDNTYAKQNGGDYEFIIEEKYALPIEQRFWDMLMLEKRKSGMFMYEQDWLDDEFDGLEHFATSATLGRQWMMQMDAGAQHAGVTIQMCMSHVRHILQSVEMPSVTNARASGDYHPGNSQWKLGDSSILAYALGIGPSKDNYWSTPIQEGTHYGPSTREWNNRLQSAVITFTTGPVAPSDKVGSSDRDLIMRCCDQAGRLLRPDRPATHPDSFFVESAFQSGGPRGEVTSTHVELDNFRWGYLIAAELQEDYNATLADADVVGPGSFKAFESNVTKTREIVDFNANTPLQLKKCGTTDFQQYTVAPVLPNGWTLLGEFDKWVSVSADRFSSLEAGSAGVSVVATGLENEKVTTNFFTPTGEIVSATCTVASNQKVKFVAQMHGVTCALG
eukprot:m.344479 g.344479  ORF g.344479 m.344479 type:complete len:749 (-) comp19854_c2_seq17:290-2536(-)